MDVGRKSTQTESTQLQGGNVSIQVDLYGITESEVTVGWGCDGGAQFLLSELNSPPDSPVKVLPAPNAIGVYTLCCNGELSNVIIYCYDSSRASISGSGTLPSPAGSFVDNDAMEGQAQVVFVARYKKSNTNGEILPFLTGEFEFVVAAGAFEFHSTFLSALVVVGTEAKLIGTGSASGVVEGSFDFILTVGEGGVRLEIWHADGTLMYDSYPNRESCGANCFSTTPLDWGSTRVHGKDTHGHYDSETGNSNSEKKTTVKTVRGGKQGKK